MKKNPSTLIALTAVFTNWRIAVAMLMGFASGVPLGLTGSGALFQAWMASENVDLTVIGVFTLVGLPYSLKFLWAPLMDRFVPPFLGRRRGWMVLCQLGLILGLALMTFANPVSQTHVVAFIAVSIAFFSASQDVVIDAYRTESLKPHELGAGTAVYILGYRVAMLFSTALALMLADLLPWRTVYFIMAASMIVGLLTSLFAPEPEVKGVPPKTIKDAVVLPFLDFFSRKGSIEMLAFAVIYKLDAVMTLSLSTPFMLELGFSKTDIGAVTKGFGLAASIIGALIGGAAIIKLGLKRSLWVFGILQGIATFSFFLLAHMGHNYPMMVVAIGAENFFSGLATPCFAAFLMSICNKRFTATQYALLSSLTTVTRTIAGAPSGFFVASFGWQAFFIICMLSAIPGLLLLLRYDRWKVTSS